MRNKYKKTIKRRLTKKRLTRKRLTRKRSCKRNYKKNKIRKGGRPTSTFETQEAINEVELEKQIREATKKLKKETDKTNMKTLGRRTLQEGRRFAKDAAEDAFTKMVPGSKAAITAYRNVTGQAEKSQKEVNEEVNNKLDIIIRKLNELNGYSGQSYNEVTNPEHVADAASSYSEAAQGMTREQELEMIQ